MKFSVVIVYLMLLSVLMLACAPAPNVVAPGSSLDPTSTPLPLPSSLSETPAQVSPLDRQRARLYAADEVARLTAIAQLESDGSPEAVLILGRFFIESNVRGRLEAARALLRINTAQSLNFIRTAMSDRQLTGRRQVAMQALEIDPEASYPILQELIVDPDEIVRLNTV